ncbi:erythromycin esterase family protein [Muricauda sp. 2012CJ35-5]|uniref:Erythromycin esterase family protein n=1 Tax=Flagellimonas spongiicola TaxID=2942208 RepID=A0ABT0PP80_9FLAO|nr:erythromycin esterase family protein [Allomuricauda spongiicola]MCL6273174.1 erythromycin esterase family protein [Allomuricauda spongiicola]
MRTYIKLVSIVFVALLSACHEKKNTSPQDHLSGQSEFVEWAQQKKITLNSFTESESNSDLEAIFQNAANYKVIALSEGFHNCKEMLQLHHRMIRYLVEEHGFNTVVTESGLPESRLAYNYIKNKPHAVAPWNNGINKMYAAWQEGRTLIEWMREYNRSHENELSYYGIDIGGFYHNWKTPLNNVLEYLETVDAPYATAQSERLEPWLEILSENARIKYINELSQADRDELARILVEMSNYFQINKDQFISKSSNQEYQWAKQSTMAMRMAENYYRNYMGQRNGTPEYVGLNGREIAMAENVKWVLEHKKDAKVILIDHVVHTKTETQHQDGLYGFFTPAGEILKQELKDSLFIVGMTYGGGKFWNDWHTIDSRFIDTIPQSSPNGIEKTMAKIGTEPYYIHWKDNTNNSKTWMNSLLRMRENNYFINIKPIEWDGCVYLPDVSPGTPMR